jgi:superfamily I DNA and/or RNA helicase
MVTSTISRTPVLSRFQGTLFEDTIRRFGEVLDSFSTLSIKELAAELSAKIPTPGSSANSSEIGILQKAIKSGGRMMSIRKLFDSIPNLLRRMCPVMLMSPISVAQYIDPSYPKFDLVIFDEASQLPTCEAVGAIARGENVIVVGDPKQLPPTSFFASNQVDEENYEKEDLESVLDDCLALSMPQKHLLWHYRSRHESLIAYSNSKYYENKLYTFPSPDDQVSEVSWVHVEGYYDKSSTRTNKAEAQAVVEEICRRLRAPELRKFSIGVVTFSLPQQNLIDDLLIDAYREDPKLEEYANEMYEPILIKNLENVRGDERCYHVLYRLRS